MFGNCTAAHCIGWSTWTALGTAAKSNRAIVAMSCARLVGHRRLRTAVPLRKHLSAPIRRVPACRDLRDPGPSESLNQGRDRAKEQNRVWPYQGDFQPVVG